MAGESPDKSEQRKSSGEAAGGERDPRLGVLRESGADSPRKTGGSATADDAGSSGSSGEARTAVATRGGDPDGAAGAGDVASDADAKSAKGGQGSEGAASGKAGVPAGGDARLKAAVAAWVASAEEEAPAGADGDGAGSSGAGSSGAGKAEDRPAAKPQRTAADGAADDDAAGSGDQPTAVFAAPQVKPVAPVAKDGVANGSGSAKQDAAKPSWAASSSPKPDAAKPAAGADQPTAVIGKAEVDAAKNAAGKGTVSADQPTELIKAPVVEPERKSQFVPLKTDSAPAPAKPVAKPAPAAPAAPKPDAFKPAVPVSVAPPAPAAPPAPGQPGQPGQAGQRQAPLDLLAQLTNTPPPPETPARTAMRRVKIWTPIAALLVIVFCVVQAFRPLPDVKLELDKQAGFTFGGDRFDMKWPSQGQSAAKVLGVGDLGTYGEQKPVPTASMAKAMTAYVILSDHPLKKGEQGEKITIDAQTAREGNSENESRAEGLKEGQSFSEYDMLQMTLISSANNVARKLARWDAGSEEAFIKKMNDTAKRLGMTNTTYTDPSGLKETTVSTAADQVKLAEQLITNPVVREITGKPNVQINGVATRFESNISNLLIKGTGVLGIKTGSNTPAGGTLMWAARKRVDGKELLIVGATMAQHFKGLDPNGENSLSMVKNVSYEQMTAVQNALQQATLVKKGQVVGYVDDQLGGRVPVVATKDVKAFGWGGLQAKFSLEKQKPLPHSAKSGKVIGELIIGTGPQAVKVPVALQKALTQPGFGTKLTRLG
ncbi:serine hydrolase [Streptomyces sp. NPDC052396]|uniref:serine hydrolase n=1 Tax=Streptomyces sp. NPDC052396 TaxID=3365689 RepID=UPI0037CCE732